MLDFQAARWLMAGEVAKQAGNDHPTGIPTGVFPTSDGHINIAASSGRGCGNASATRSAGRTGRPSRPGRPRRAAAPTVPRINAAIGEITRTQPANHWIELFESNGIPCGPINTIDQVFADPQVQHLGMARVMKSPVVGDKPVVASALTISGFSKDIRLPTPEAGSSTEQVLRSVGYTDAELAALRSKGVI